MAKATFNVKNTKKMVEVETQEKKTFTLELTEAEAIALNCILRSIGGSTQDTPRFYTQEIEKALEKAKVKILGDKFFEEGRRSIYWEPKTLAKFEKEIQ